MKRSLSRSLMALVGAAMILPAMALTSCIADDGEALTPPAAEYPEVGQKPVPELPVGMRDKGQWTSLGSNGSWQAGTDVPKIFDGQTSYESGYWHSNLNNAYPYWVAVKMEDVFEMGGFIFWNRGYKDTDNGMGFPRDVVFYVGTNPDAAQESDVKWTEVCRGTIPDSGENAVDRPPFAILLPTPVSGDCIKIEILNNYRNGQQPWTFIAEIDIIQPEFYDREDYPGVSDVYF